MFMRTQIPLDELRQAFREFMAANGRPRALAALREAAGTRDLAAIPESKYPAVMVALGRPHRGRRLGEIHARLHEMANSIFGPKGSHERTS